MCSNDKTKICKKNNSNKTKDQMIFDIFLKKLKNLIRNEILFANSLLKCLKL